MSALHTRLAFVSLCGLTSYIWSSNVITKYAVLDDPQTTLLLVLLLASGILRFASFYVGRVPGAGAPAYDPISTRKAKAKSGQSGSLLPSGVPEKPSPYLQHVLIFCLILRVSAFHSVNSQQQCSSSGLEPLFGLLVFIYDFAYNPADSPPEPDGPEDMWASVWDDFVEYLKTTPLAGLSVMALISLCTYITTTQTISSTYFCSSIVNNASYTVFLQLVGLILDTVCTVLLWRILWWAKTAKVRLRILSHTLFITVLGCGLMVIHSKYSTDPSPFIVTPGVVIHDGLALAIWLVSFCQILCETSLVGAPTLVVAAVGVSAGIVNMLKLGSWLQISRFVSICPLLFILVALIFQTVSLDYSVMSFGSRFTIYSFLLTSIFICLIMSLFSTDPFHNHPLKRMIYERRVENQRWLIHAGTSKFLRVAVSEYKLRYHRDPPHGFSQWFRWAMDHNAIVIDNFDQISSDLAPFWHIPPAELRARTKELGKDPDVALISVRDSNVSSNLPKDLRIPELDTLLSIVSEFAEHLPDLEFAVNLAGHPRVLPVGAERIYPFSLSSTTSKRSRVQPNPDDTHIAESSPSSYLLDKWKQTEASYFRRMYVDACPKDSPVYRGQSYMLSDHCTACESAHGTDWSQFPDEWDKALDTCLQPDLMHLHSFFSYSPTSHRVYSKLMPLFGKTKVGPFGDIIIPFDEQLPANFDSNLDFEDRQSHLFWRGNFTEVVAPQTHDLSPLGSETFVRDQAFHADLQHRAVHLVNNASASQLSTMVISRKVKKLKKSKKGKKKAKSTWEFEYIYSHMRTSQLNSLLPFDMAFDASSHICSQSKTRDLANCIRAKSEFNSQPRAIALENRFVFLPDSPLKPAPETLQTLHSASVPFVSTIFRQWWTERVHPWVHFVPIDPRLQALHSTLAYFTGLTIPEPGHEHDYEHGNAKTNEESKQVDEEDAKEAEGETKEVDEVEAKEGAGSGAFSQKDQHERDEPGKDRAAVQGANGQIMGYPGVGITDAEPTDSEEDSEADAESDTRPEMNYVEMKAAESDARWIALEGRSWARKVLRREDAGVYLYRLLLEWGRLVSDDRDSAGEITESI
ncbi:hypothetical protein CFIMG_003981RAa [Ceratocystis fimbriata CBS 114723]|uniref:Glycosyl transferase CAP10 domain-containing protein n=1 Tax=Ceratocystis fimbriata CBS 114723 TaxID=1035309 RepID=A0A2C5WZL5_9PEZI|nr:hypothetical protein CFIMG_003981RAa [Ceratocystis fimbriata CBS 114723]